MSHLGTHSFTAELTLRQTSSKEASTSGRSKGGSLEDCINLHSEFRMQEKSVTSHEFAGHHPHRKFRRRGGLDGSTKKQSNVIFDFSSAQGPPRRHNSSRGSGFFELLLRNPVAAVALIPDPLVLFSAGALAGALGKTLTAPLDRVKLLLQTGGGFSKGSLKTAAQKGSLVQSLIAIGREEGIAGYWKGNVPQILKVVPYSAMQLYSYEVFKWAFSDEKGNLSVPSRLAAGACAGMTATLATYPLDTLRLRMAVDPKARSIRGISRTLLHEGSYKAFFRGLGPSLLGIAPYMALELCIFDSLPKRISPFVRGFSAALISTSVCYPLDTVRRHIQLQSTGRLALHQMARDIARREGIAGFYRGFIPSAVKNLPNKGIRLTVFDGAKKLLATSNEAYEQESLQMLTEPCVAEA